MGKFLELLLTPVAITVQTEVQVTSNPPKVDILLLRRQGAHWTPHQQPGEAADELPAGKDE